MALPDKSYPIRTYADLQRAMYAVSTMNDSSAIFAVRDLLVKAHNQDTQDIMKSRNVNYDPGRHLPSHVLVPKEQLLEIQRLAAEHGLGLEIFSSDRNTVIPPPPLRAIAPPAVPKPPPVPDIAQGLTFASHQRIGDEIRDKHIEHIHDMFARGFLDQKEHDARIAAAMRALTKEQLALVIQDLPNVPLPAPPPPVKKEFPADVMRILFAIAAAGFPFMSLTGFLAGGHVLASAILALAAGVALILSVVLAKRAK